jgi:serine/threonine protein kinase
MSSVMPGSRLGPYEILALIGAGGMGQVWKARDSRLDRIVAIKVAQERFSERFEREARTVAALNHPHICSLFDVGPDYLVMEYIEGTPLKGPLPTGKVIEYSGQILEALEAAHRKGITHRDLKPGNILVTKQGIKLLDFGLARMASAPGDEALTVTGAVMGTPGYMAPEQWDGKPGDARSDIYAFGCVLYETITGKRAQQENASVESVEPAPLARVLQRCLAREPDQRFQNALDLKLNIGWAIEQPPATKPERRWWVAAAIAMLTFWRRPSTRLAGRPCASCSRRPCLPLWRPAVCSSLMARPASSWSASACSTVEPSLAAGAKPGLYKAEIHIHRQTVRRANLQSQVAEGFVIRVRHERSSGWNSCR